MTVVFSNFNCISIQKDHLILNMNHLLFKAAHPIYEDIYSQVNKSGKNNKMVMAEQPNNCDTDSAALERLSQLLTTTTDGASEVSADLIALHVTNSLDDFTNFFHNFFSINFSQFEQFKKNCTKKGSLSQFAS